MDDDYTEENKRYSMADPSGGPYISKGQDMGIEDEKFKGKIVEYISFEDGKVIINV